MRATKGEEKKIRLDRWKSPCADFHPQKQKSLQLRANIFQTGNVALKSHCQIKGRFRKRVVLANVPSCWFSFRGNIRRNHPFGNHPFVNKLKAHWEIKGRFRKRVVLANVPSFRISFRGNIRRNHPFETTLLRTPENPSKYPFFLRMFWAI